ncbi:MAG: ATPase [Omnitrophica bacterium GWA2_52_12]|nr:MAG: ATPase [Omnitrophica bacterium GWA2_52_12]
MQNSQASLKNNGHWHAASIQEVLGLFNSSLKGLDSAEAAKRLIEAGPNRLDAAKKRTPLGLFFSQFKDFMILLLLFAACVSAFAGDLKDTIAIAAILVLNAVIGFTQEYRAERAMEALRAMAAPNASVLRDGNVTVIAASDLVPGDMVLLEAGRIVPADLRLVESAQLRVDESALTGESLPVEKISDSIQGDALSLGDRRNMAYKGTVVTYGRASGLVTASGMKTEFGKIAAMLQGTGEVKTPLQKRLARFGKRLSFAAIGICAVVFSAGILRGEDPLLMFMTAVSLAVAAIPEALPAVVTISLALGAKKMVQKKALMRKLPAVETLGSVTYICTDKTGTLTLNRMRAEEFYCDGRLERLPGNNPVWGKFLTGMALSNDARAGAGGVVAGDPTEIAFYEAAGQNGFAKEALEKTAPRMAEIPFDSIRKCMTTFHQKAAGNSCTAYTKGAVEVILEKSTHVLTSAGRVPIDREKLSEAAERMAGDGLRVLALAQKDWEALPPAMNPSAIENNLTLLGFAGLLDPPREEAHAAVETCKTAGIIPVMITGDHPGTARAIAGRLGILEDGEGVMTGAELEKIGAEEFKTRVESIRVYARVSPEQKLKIVTALQERGQFVAMTGDGVNDAPALKRADIGVAMGITGTDVAKEASSMILLDDNFATIVRAVKEGRRIYDNMRRFIRYAVSTNSSEVWIIFLAPFLGLPLPFLPIQILWINLLTDGLPGLALAAEPAEKNVMQRPPRPPAEGVFAHGLGIHVIWVGLFMAGLTLGAEAVLTARGTAHWQSILFTVLCLSQLAHVMAIRSETESLWTQGVFSNKPLLAAVSVTCLLQMGVLYIPALNDVFKTQPLTAVELTACFALSSAVFFAVELEKWIRRTLSI